MKQPIDGCWKSMANCILLTSKYVIMIFILYNQHIFIKGHGLRYIPKKVLEMNNIETYLKNFLMDFGMMIIPLYLSYI